MTLPDWAVEIKKRLDAATPGSWKVVETDGTDFTAIQTDEPQTSEFLANEVLGTSEWLRCEPWDLELMANSPQDIARLLEALEIAMEVLHDQKDVTFKLHLHRNVIGSYGYESGLDERKEYKSAGEALKKIHEIGEKK